MSSALKIGDLAQQTGLSVRTLHYYDEIGLLSPSRRSEAGHRLYQDSDIVRLQRILSLRQLGFSLKEIQNCLDDPSFALPQVIDLHRARLRAELDLSRSLLEKLDAIAAELSTTQTIAVETLIQTMEALTMTAQYFTAEQQATLEQRFQDSAADWQDLVRQLEVAKNNKMDLNHPQVRLLARRWLYSMENFIQGDTQIFRSLTRLYQHEGPTAASQGTLDTETFAYLVKAVSFLSLAESTDLLLPTADDFTPQTRDVLRQGEAAMRQLNFDIFGTEAMLLGLLLAGNSSAAQLLTAIGVELDSVQTIIAQALELPDYPISLPPILPYAPRTKRVLELALALAQQNSQQIAPEHLLLGILAEAKETGGGLATHALQTIGVDLAELEAQQTRLL